MQNSERQDIYTRITTTIVASLEQGVRPWMKPWSGENAAGRISRPLRHNGTPYSGINILMLWGASVEHGFTSPNWMTFRQALALNAHVRKSEKGSLVVYANTFTRTEDALGRPFVGVPLHSGGLSTTLRQQSGRWAFFETASFTRNTGYNLRDFSIGDHRNNDFNQFDAAVGTIYAEDYELSLRGENLLNDTTTPNGTSSGNFTRTPMAFYVSAGATF